MATSLAARKVLAMVKTLSTAVGRALPGKWKMGEQFSSPTLFFEI